MDKVADCASGANPAGPKFPVAEPESKAEGDSVEDACRD